MSSLPFALLMLCGALHASNNKIQIETLSGPVVGTQYETLEKFINIPFAKPPLDELRFQAPQAVDKWTAALDGEVFGRQHFNGFMPACIQVAFPLDPMGPRFASEDCLYLNVVRHRNSTSTPAKRAVLVWIYGGSFLSGSSTQQWLYDPTNFLEHIPDVIIVSFNYRLGLLGSLYDNTFNTGVRGNQGFQDQIMAIQWVYENIAFFGGDPERVTLFGQSAGAHSVGLHLLFNNQHIANGIMQSPPFGLELRDPVTWYDVVGEFSALMGCDNVTDSEERLDCWQSVPANDVLLAQYNPALLKHWSFSMPFTPTVNTSLVPQQPIQAWQNESISTPPFIIGVNRDECFLWVNASDSPTYQKLFAVLAQRYGANNTALIFDRYGITENSTDLNEYYGRIETDASFRCAIRNVAQNSALNHNDVWFYEFNVVDVELYSTVFFSQPSCWSHTCHGAEVLFLWLPQNLSSATGNFNLPDVEDVAIGRALQRYWSSFAQNNDPNPMNASEVAESYGVIEWDAYTMDAKLLLRIGANETRTQTTDDSICDFWDVIGYVGQFCADCDASSFTPSPSAAEDDKRKGLSTGAIVGIVVVVVAVLLIAVAIFSVFRWSDKANPKRQSLVDSYVPMTDRKNSK